jgi:hypothetical protein
MRRGWAFLKIAAFVMVATAPVIGLVFGGAVSPYGQKPHARFPDVLRVIEGKRGAFDQVGKAVLDRSPVTEAAIRLKGLIGYGGFDYIDTDRIISGRDGWLFYKEEFSGGRCLQAEELSAALDQVGAMIETAGAAGLDLVVGISPDKGSIYPEYLNPLARRYWACKIENSQLWRRLLAKEFGHVLDHAVPLLREKIREPRARLYFKTDTHWTPFGAALALRQVIGAVGQRQSLVLPPPLPTGRTLARPTDMANEMLLLPGAEDYDEIDSTIENRLSQTADIPRRQTVVLHDSFYYVLRPSLSANFPGARFFHLEQDATEYRPLLASAERIIVNSAERGFLSRVSGGTLSWSGPLGQAILDRSAKVAGGCTDLRTIDPVGPLGGALIPVAIGDAAMRPCLRVDIEAAQSADLVIRLPTASQSMADVPTGGTIRKSIAAGRQTVMLALPDGVRGKKIWVGPAGDSRSGFAMHAAMTGQAPPRAEDRIGD